MQSHFLIDGASKTCLYVCSNDFELSHFLHHNVKDTQLATCDEYRWANILKESKFDVMPIESVNYNWFHLKNNLLLPTIPNESIKAKRKRIELLHHGYKFLLVYINSFTSDINYATFFITIEDIMLFNDINELAPALSENFNLDIETAKKQLNFEKNCLLQVHKYKKSILWKYTTSLLELTSIEELDTWKLRIRSELTRSI